MVSTKHPTMKAIRELYDARKSVIQIAAKLNMKRTSVYFWIYKIRNENEGRVPLSLKDDNINRAQWEGFKKYWIQRPFHFEELYHMNFTPENMKRAWRECVQLLHQVRNSPNVLINQIPDVPIDDDVYGIGYDRSDRGEQSCQHADI